ncbi:hypothetical protein CTAYLR_009237 [Chrysophaeum taylorii]|uniref:Intraflagellar transport protein 122 homolog n=1 Tax=Chrysophaeum taylorii TaxID=2483200 RepID=A0AAD7UK33_9STRA|nr:hypothetical protein CTAYLR_009237 [Chrysophaeum taylorii]
MEAKQVWQDPGLPPKGNVKATVYSMAYAPSGKEVVVAVSSLVLVYATIDGDLRHRLRGHKDTVYALAYAPSGSRFASGGADRTVIIWNDKGEGILKFTHNDSIQCVCYSKSEQLTSCTASDFGLWSKEQKSVTKHKISSKILSCTWGDLLALGMASGTVQIRDKKAAEHSRFERNGPVWCVAWCDDTLVVGAWDETLAFYHNGVLIKERKIGSYPVSLCPCGPHLVVGGSDRTAALYTREGVRLATICEDAEWVFSVVSHRNNSVGVGSYGGAISLWHLEFEAVYGLASDRFAFTEKMTDVIVQQAEKRVRIKSRERVVNIALYMDRLAIQLPDRVNVYECDEGDLHYRLRKEHGLTGVSSQRLVGITAHHVLLCTEAKLLLYQDQQLVRQWILDVAITSIVVDGGPAGREGLIVGLENGAVLKLYLDNAFPVELVPPSSSGIVVASLSPDRKRLLMLSTSQILQIYEGSKVVMVEEDVTGAAFNAHLDDCVCYSQFSDKVAVRFIDKPALQHKIKGRVVGSAGSKVFVVDGTRVEAVDLPQSQALSQHIADKDFETAHKLACLGVTEADWRRLAIAAARAMNLETARAAYSRVHDLRLLEVLKDDKDADVLQGELLAYAGQYQEAAKVFSRAGKVQLAIDLFADLRQWEEAKMFAASSDVDSRELVRRQAEWAEEIEDWNAAAEMYVSVDPARAVQLLGERRHPGWVKQLASIARTVTGDVLRKCATYFLDAGEDELAREVYAKLDDVDMLIELHVRKQQWAEAIALAGERKNTEKLYLPYAEYLALHDQFDEALDAYRKAGRPDQASRMMEQLTFNAVVESRFKDASYYYWRLATESLRSAFEAGGPDAVHDALPFYQSCLEKADAYYAYSFLESFFLPFTPVQPEVLFNAARFLVNTLGTNEAPLGISRVKILYTLAKQAKTLGAYKLARFAYDKLAHTKVDAAWVDSLEVDMVTVHAKPVRDSPDLLPVCYRCGAANALLNPATARSHNCDVCASCGHPFVRSFLTFDILPLIEFLPAPPITDDEALSLIREPPTEQIGDDDDGDLFTKAINRTLSTQDDAYVSVTVDADTLASLRREEVYVCAPRHPGMRATFYKSALPDVHLAISQHRFFHEEDFEFAVLRDGHCPYSRLKDLGDTGPC